MDGTRKGQKGVTLVELVMVIILLGILSAIAIPQLRRTGIDGRNFFDRTLSSIRFAQKLAIAQRRDVFVCLGGSSVAVGFGADCSVLARDPGGGAISFDNSGVAISGASFSFDDQGQVSAQQDIIISVPDTGDSYSLRVEALTGYAHPL
jgi:MSHA pilin protein MshC